MSLGMHVFGPGGGLTMYIGNKRTTWTRGLVAGLGVVTMAAVMSATGPRESRMAATTPREPVPLLSTSVRA